MSKVIRATCSDLEVVAAGVPVPSAEIFSEGKGDSDGVLIIDRDEAFYIPNTTPDLKETLDKVVDALTSIASALSALDGAGFLIAATAGVPSPPIAAGAISTINSLKAELEELKEDLQ